MDPAAGVFPSPALSESGSAPSGRVLPSHLFPGFATPRRTDSYAASDTPSRGTSTRSPYVSGRLDFGYSDRPSTTLPVYETQRSRGGFASPSSAAPVVVATGPSPKTPSSDRYGPPTDSLYGMLSAPAAKQPTQQVAAVGGTGVAAPPTESLSPMRRDMFFHEVPQPLPAAAAQAPAPDASNQLGSWVTVFGFSPANSSFVLRHFQDVGTVLQHRPSHGNWMHLQFSSLLEAQVALSKNGKVLGGVLMVGVIPCTDRDVLSSSKEAEPRVVRRAVYDPSRDPLATREIPQERNSLWSKTMEHVFGL